MTRRDEVIRMAQEAGLIELHKEGWAPVFQGSADDIDRFSALVAAAKQEQCAKACEAWGHECHGEGRDDSEAFDCADLIRALKDGEE